MAWLSRKYFDPFIERLGGIDQETLGRPRLKISLLVILAIGVVAFATRSIDQAFEREPQLLWVLGLMHAFTAGLITLAWAEVCADPERATEFGAFTGATLFSVPFALGMATWAIMIGRQVDDLIMLAIVLALECGLYGLFGGLAVERRWGGCLAMRVGLNMAATSVGLSVGISGVLNGAFLGFLTGAVEDPNFWKELLTRMFFIAVGWAWGLTLFPKSEDVLKPRKKREDLDCVTPADQLRAEHNS